MLGVQKENAGKEMSKMNQENMSESKVMSFFDQKDLLSTQHSI